MFTAFMLRITTMNICSVFAYRYLTLVWYKKYIFKIFLKPNFKGE